MGLLDNIFATQQPEYMTSLLGQDAVDKLRKQSLTSGIINTLVGYAAAPKNKNLGLGRILAGAYQQGMTGAQNTYDKATQDYIQGIKMQDLKKSIEAKKKIEDLAPNLYTQGTPAQYADQTVSGGYAPAQTDINPDQTSPNFNVIKQPDITQQVMTQPAGKPQLNYDVLQQMLGISPAEAAPYITGSTGLKTLMTPVKEPLTIIPKGGTAINNKGEVIATGAPDIELDPLTKMIQNRQIAFKNNPNDPMLAVYDEAINNAKGGLNQYQRAQIDIRNKELEQGKIPSGYGVVKDAKGTPILDENGNPKLTIMLGGPADIKNQEKAQAAGQFSTLLDSLRTNYDQLDKIGGITHKGGDRFANISASTGASGLGQVYGKLTGTEAQSYRNEINASRPLLLQAIKSATGMSSKQMDSNVELQQYLKAATDPTVDYESNMKALDKLETLYASGKLHSAGGTKLPTATNVNASPLDLIDEELKKRKGK